MGLALLTSSTLNFAHQENMIEFDQNIHMKAFTENEAEYLHPDTVPTKTLKVVGMQITGFDKAGLAKMQAAFAITERVVNSIEFKDRVINFKNTAGQRAFRSNKGMTNEEIYEDFMDGRETLQQNTPGEMNFFLKLYNRPWSRVIGYTSADVNLININKRFFKNYQPADVAGNLVHEWTHKLGFDHTSASEHDSAPYAIGYIAEEMASDVLAGKLELHYDQ